MLLKIFFLIYYTEAVWDNLSNFIPQKNPIKSVILLSLAVEKVASQVI